MTFHHPLRQTHIHCSNRGTSCRTVQQKKPILKIHAALLDFNNRQSFQLHGNLTKQQRHNTNRNNNKQERQEQQTSRQHTISRSIRINLSGRHIILIILSVCLSFVAASVTSSSSITTRGISSQLSSSIRLGLRSALSSHHALWGTATTRTTTTSATSYQNTRISPYTDAATKSSSIPWLQPRHHDQLIRSVSTQQQQHWNGQQQEEEDIHADDDDTTAVETAFYRTSSEFDLWNIRSIQSALLFQRRKFTTSSITETEEEELVELDCLEKFISSGQNNIPASASVKMKTKTTTPASSTSIMTKPAAQYFPLNRNSNRQDLTVHANICTSPSINKILKEYNNEETNIVLASIRRHPTLSSLPNDLRAGAIAALAAVAARPLAFWENMICGAISRSVAQTAMHPANTMKTILQNSRAESSITAVELMHPKNFLMLTRGAGANFLLSVPHGAINFAVLEFVRKNLSNVVAKNDFLSRNENKFSAGLDFLSSALSTITCSIVSTPQMMIIDNIMAGNYPNMMAAIKGLAQNRGIHGFYAGWWPGLVGKIPSYALTWTFFQQLKLARDRFSDRPTTDMENFIMGCIASATTVTIMIPLDTIKTRLVTQAGRVGTDQAYKGIVDCAVRMFKEEGIKTFYRGLPPRLVSVVPMIGIQFGVYEFMKKVMLQRKIEATTIQLLKDINRGKEYGTQEVLEEALMECAASPDEPYPAPHFLHESKQKQEEETKILQEASTTPK